MPKGSPKKGRSASRGRPAKIVKTPKSPTPEPPAKFTMDFDENEKVMARWPGTNLFFKAKVTFVRDDDNQYDITFEDGTTFTLKAKDVKKEIKPKEQKPTPARSRSRGRSPGRKPKSDSPARQVAPKESAAKAPKPEATPTRTSARIAAARAAELSSDEDDSGKNKSSVKTESSKCTVTSFFSNLSFAWIGTLFFMALGPFILVSIHTLCTKTSCKPELPFNKIPKNLAAYWDSQAFVGVVAFGLLLRLLSLLPIGKTVKAVSGHDIRMNGFIGLLTLLAVAPALVYRKIDLSFVADKYFHIMISSLILAFCLSTIAAIVAKFFGGKKSNVNPKGNTGNPIVDFFNGREFNPYFARADLKLQTFRFSMMGLAVLNVLLVLNAVAKNNNQVNPVVALAAAFQVVYALDAMFFEEYFFFSYDAMNTGYGFSLISMYHSFPFLPTIITQYLIQRNPTMNWYYLVAIGLMNILGYILFRRSESQRCEAAKDPKAGALKHLESNTGCWNYIRYPNYLGEILIQWSWVLPAACTAGRTDLLIYYLPVFTTLMFLMRCSQQNSRNQKKLGSAWTNYCKRVPANLIPKVF